ncbi:MAG: polysaccharide deacetylase family protein [Alicyclobacillaceae bacterium]|nr:polysaccharide deacetylase family protein [Alicyclobacillaceae bacterium]
MRRVCRRIGLAAGLAVCLAAGGGIRAGSPGPWSLEEIRQRAPEQAVAPENARIDRVWKAIPDLNGLEVDVEATWRRVREGSRSPSGGIPWVFRQVPADVRLKDLPPAPIYRGNPHKKQMALMVNVSWGEDYIRPLLEIFDRHGVKGTFFLDGKWAERFPQSAAEIARRGHEIGDHGWGHPDLRGRGESGAEANLRRSREAILRATGKAPVLFAPPAGQYDDAVVRAARRMGMYTVMWTLDTVDWRHPPVPVMVRRVVGRAEPGALVLMHPTERTPEALDSIIAGLRRMGYELVTVSELLSPERPVPPS